MPSLEETLAQFSPDQLQQLVGGFDQVAPAVDPAAQARAALAAVPEQVIGRSIADQSYQSTNLIQPGTAPDSIDMLAPGPGVQPNDRLAYPGNPTGQPIPSSPADIHVGVDRFGAERGAPDLSGTAGFDPNANQYVAPGQPGNVAEADQQVANQASFTASAQEKASQAALDAQRDRSAREAAVYERFAGEQASAQHDFEVTRSLNNQIADRETADWLQEMTDQAAKEPSPGRWFDNQSSFGKAMWAIGLAFSSLHTAVTPGARNAVLDMVRQNIANDMDEQRARLKSERATLELKGSAMKDRQARNMSDARDDYSMALGRINALEKAWMARAVAPGDADALQAKADSALFFEQLKAPIIQNKRNELVAAREAQAARNHAARMQAAQQTFQAGQNALERQKDMDIATMNDKRMRDLSPVDFSVGRTAAKPAGVDEHGLPVLREVVSGAGSNSGLILAGPDGKPANGDGVFRTRDDKAMQEASDVVTKANKRYTMLKELADKLDAGAAKGALGTLVGVTDPEIESLLRKVGYANAKEQDSRVTDRDFSNGVGMAVGFDPDGKTLDRIKFQTNYDQIRDMVKRDMANMPNYVSQQLNNYNDQGINGRGTRAVWDPRNMQTPEPPAKTTSELTGRPNAEPPKPVESVKDYQARRQKEATDPEERGRQLPQHDTAVVDATIANTQFRGPKAIQQLAQKTLKDLETKRAALSDEFDNDPDVRRNAGQPSSPTGKPHSPEERAKLVDELNKVQATIDIVNKVSRDAEKKATKAVKDAEEWATFARTTWGASDDSIRENIKKKYGLTRALDDIDEIVKRVNANKAANFGRK